MINIILKDLLSSHKLSGNDTDDKVQFLYNSAGDHISPGGIVLTFYIDRELLRKASIAAMRQHHHIFAGQSLKAVSSLLSEFTRKSIGTLGSSTVISSLGKALSLSDLATDASLISLSEDLTAHIANAAEKSLYLISLPGVAIPKNIISDQFFWVSCGSNLNDTVKQLGPFTRSLLSNKYPPWAGASPTWPLSETDSWIGCLEASPARGRSTIHSFLGALSMAVDPAKSRSFTYAPPRFPKGHLMIQPNGKCIIYYDQPPYLPEGLGVITLSEDMLKVVQRLIVKHASNQRIQVALEYLAAGWQPVGRMGFLHNAIAIDALFGEEGRVGKSILAGLETFGSKISNIREKGTLLYKMRNRLLHGESQSLESCPEYLDYLEQFGKDPAHDQITILRSCLWEISAKGDE